MPDTTKVKPKNVWKVARVLAKNPNATQAEIAHQAWIARNTVIKAKEELSKNWTKDETIAFIVDRAKERIRKVSAIFDRFVSEAEAKKDLDRSDVYEIRNIVKDDLARVTVLGWDVTDKDWGLKITKDTPDEVLDQILYGNKD